MMKSISSDVMAIVEKFARECSDEYSKSIDRKDQIVAYVTGETEQYPDIMGNSNSFPYYTFTQLEKLRNKNDDEIFFRAAAVVLRVGNKGSRRYYSYYDSFLLSLGDLFRVDSLDGKTKESAHKFETLLYRLEMISKYAGEQVIEEEIKYRMKYHKFTGKELCWVKEGVELLMLLDLYSELDGSAANEHIESLPPLLQAVLHGDEKILQLELQHSLSEIVLHPLPLKDNDSTLNLAPDFVQATRDRLHQTYFPNASVDKGKQVPRHTFESVLLQVSSIFLYRMNRYGGKKLFLEHKDSLDEQLITAVQVLYDMFPFEIRQHLIMQRNKYKWINTFDFAGILTIDEPYELIENLLIDLDVFRPSWDNLRNKILANVDQALRVLQIAGNHFIKLFVYKVLSEQEINAQQQLTGSFEELVLAVLDQRRGATRVAPYLAKYMEGKVSIEGFLEFGDRENGLDGKGNIYDRKQRRMLFAIGFLPIDSEQFRRFIALLMHPDVDLTFVLKVMSDGYKFSYSRLLERYENDPMVDGKALVESILFQPYDTYGSNPALQEQYRNVVYTHIDETLAVYKKLETLSRQFVLELLFAKRENIPMEQFAEAVRLGLTDSSKAINNIALTEFNSKPDTPLFMQLFRTEKKATIKEMALSALRGMEDSKVAYTALLQEKQNGVMKELLTILLETSDQGVHVAHAALASRIDGKKKARLSFIPVKHMPALLDHSGNPLDDNIKLYLLSQSLEYGSQPNLTLKEVENYADQASLAQFAAQILQLWLGEGAPAKEKWVLYLSCLFGDRQVMNTLADQIKDWAENSRGAIAAEAIKALSFMKDTAALMIIDRLKRVIKNRQVKTAADEALQLVAENMNLSQAQLEDKLITTLGFNDQGEQSISYGERNFIVKVSADLQVVVVNEDTGKLLKNLPAATQKDDPELVIQGKAYLTQLKKDLKNMVKLQALRLEESLSKQRLWSKEDWQELFINNIIMQKFAIGLIWGVYEGANLVSTFRYMEDGTFNTVDEEEYELPAEAKIGLVQPLELEVETLKAWQQQLEDYEITQPFTQLHRQVYTLNEEEQIITEIISSLPEGDFSPTSFPKALEKLGWYKGPAEDAGFYYLFYKDYDGVIAELEFSGTSISYYEGMEEISLKALRFFNNKKIRYHYFQPNDAMKLSLVPPRVYSETMYDILRAAGRV